MKRLLIAALLVAAPLAAQTDGRDTQFKDPLLDNLVGTWDAPGHVKTREVHMRVTAEWVLNHQFLQIKMQDTATPSTYEAWVLIGYDYRSDRYVVHWADVFGGRFSQPIAYGTRGAPNAVQFVFEYGDGPFRNTLAWNAREKSWRWLIEDKDDANRWRTWAEYDLRQRPLAASNPDERSPR